MLKRLNLACRVSLFQLLSMMLPWLSMSVVGMSPARTPGRRGIYTRCKSWLRGADGFGEFPLSSRAELKRLGPIRAMSVLESILSQSLRDWLEIAMNDGGGREFVGSVGL